MNSGDQFVIDNSGNVVLALIETSSGLRLRRYSSSGVLSQDVLVNPVGQSPSISYDDLGNFVYLVYVVPGTPPIGREFKIVKYDASNFTTPLWNVTYSFYTPIDGTNPKMLTPWSSNKSSDPRTVQVAYVDQAGLVSILKFDPSDGALLNKFDTGFDTNSANDFYARYSRQTIYLALRKPVTESMITKQVVQVLRYNATNYARIWFVNIDAGDIVNVKSNFFIVEDTSNLSVYLSFRNGSTADFRMSKILTNGTVSWTTNSGVLPITTPINNRIHNLFLFEGTPMISYVRTGGTVVFMKVSDTDGSPQTPARETSLSGFLPGDVSGTPALISAFPWERLYVSYTSSSTSLNVFQTFTSTLTSVISDPDEISQYQFSMDDTSTNSYLIYRDVTGTGEIKIRCTKNDNTILFDAVVAPSGYQTPGVVCRNAVVYYSVARFVTSFSEYLELKLFRAPSITVDLPTWTRTIYVPVSTGSSVRPRILVTNNRAILAYGRDNGFIYLSTLNLNTGVSISSVTLDERSSDVSELAISTTLGSANVLVAAPSYTNPNKVWAFSLNSSTLALNFKKEVMLGDNTQTKTNLFVRQSLTISAEGEFYLIGKTTTTNQYRVSQVSTSGEIWTSDSGVEVGRKVIGCHLFQDYVLLFFINSSGNLVCQKITTDGNVSSKTTTGLTLPTTSPKVCLLSQDVFSKYFLAWETPSLDVDTLYNSVASTTGTSSLRELSKYQQVDDTSSSGFQYITYHDSGVRISKRNSSGTEVSNAIVEATGYNPSLALVSGALYVSYSILNITLTNYVTLTMKRINPGSLATVWTKSQTFPDSALETFFPRITYFGSNIHNVFVRNNNAVYSSAYNSLSGNLVQNTPYSTGLSTTSAIDKRDMAIARTSYSNSGNFSLYISLPTGSGGNIKTAKYSPAYVKAWERQFNGGTLTDKSGLFVEEDVLNQSVIVSYSDNLTTQRVTKLLSNGTVQVGFDGVDSTLSGLYGGKLSAMYVFDEFVLLFGVKSATGFIETIKLVISSGTVLGPSKVSDVGFVLSNVLSTPTILSSDPWSAALGSYLLSTTLLPYVQSLTVTGAVSVTVTTTEASEYQSAIDSQDNIYTIYYGGSPEGVAMTKFDKDDTVRLQRRFDFNGQTPCIGYSQSIDSENLYVSYTKNVSAFTDYLGVSLKKVNRTTLTDVWSVSKLYTDPSSSATNFRPRVQISGDLVYVIYKNASENIVVQGHQRATGALTFFVTTSLLATSVPPEEISVKVVPSLNSLFIGYPVPTSSSINLVRFSLVSGTITWQQSTFETSVSGAKTAIKMEYDSTYGFYVSYTTSGNILRTALVDPSTGSAVWSVAPSGITGIYGGRANALYLIGGLPLIFAIEEVTANLKVAKLNPSDGSLISIRTKHLETFDTDLYVGPPALFSRNPWDVIWLVYPDPTGPLYENWAILVNKLVTEEVPDPSTNQVELSERQFVIDSNDNMYSAFIKEYRPDISTLPSSIPDSWLNGYGKITMVNSNSIAKLYLVETLTSSGLTMYVERSTEASGFGSSYTKFNVTIINTTSGTTMTNLRIEDEVVPSGMAFEKFATFASIAPGATVTTTLDIDFNETYLVDIPFNVKTTYNSINPITLLPVVVNKTFPASIARPAYEIKAFATYSTDISPYGLDFTRIQFTISNLSSDVTLSNVTLDNQVVPSGMTFYSFPTITSIVPSETTETTMSIDFNEILGQPVTFDLKATYTFTNPQTSSEVVHTKRYSCSIEAPTTALDFGSNGPNVVSISKVSSDGVVRIYNDIDVGGEAPAIYVDNGNVYSAYSKRLVTFTEFMSITVQKSDSSNLEPLWIVTRRYTDSFVEYFKPRIVKTNSGIHLIYFRQDGFLYIETFNPTTGALVGDPVKTVISTTMANVDQLAAYSTSQFIYLALPTPGSGNIVAYRINPLTSYSIAWSVTFNSGTLTPKTGIVMKASENDLYTPTENIFLGYTDNATLVKLSMITPSGTVAWSSSTGVTMVEVYGQRIHGLYVFGGYPSVFFIRDRTTYVSCTGVKFDDLGTIIDTKDVALPVEFETGFISTYPVLATRSPWETIFVEFYTFAELDYVEVSPSTRLAVIAVDCPFSYTVTVPESELSEYQMDDNFLVYTDQGGITPSGVRLVKTNSSGTILSNTLVDANGQSPSVVISGSYVYVSYIRYQSAFLGSTIFARKQYSTSTVTLISTEETDYPDSIPENLRPRLVASDDKLYTAYRRQNGKLFLERMSLPTPSTDFVVETALDVSTIDPLSIVYKSGPDNFNIAYPQAGSGDILVRKYDEDLVQLWSIVTSDTGTSNVMIREDLGTFIMYNDSLGNVKLVKYNEATGVLEWSNSLGAASQFVGSRNHSYYALFNYPLIFNVNTSAEVEAIKFSEEGALVSTRSTALSGLNVGDIQNYPVVISRSPWNTLTLGYYSGVGVGSVAVSPSKSIAIQYFSAPLTYPTPLPTPEVSDNQVVVSGDFAFFVHADETLGTLLVTKHQRSTGTIVSSYSPTIAAKPFSPSLRYSDNKLYVSFCTFTVGYTEIVEMFIMILNSSDLSLIALTSRGLPDPDPATFRPRIAPSGTGVVYRTYERYVRDVVIEKFDTSTYDITDPIKTGISYLGGDNQDISLVNGGVDGVYLVYPPVANLSSVNVRKYLTLDDLEDGPDWETTGITGGYPAETKKYTIGRTDESQLFISMTSGGSKAVLVKLDPSNGTVEWSAVPIIIPGSQRLTHGMDIFNEFPMIYTIRSSTNEIVVSKFNKVGTQVSSRTTSLVGFNYLTNVSSPPVVVSNYPWDNITVFHTTPTLGLYYQPGRNVSARRYTSPITYVLPAQSSDVRTSQGSYQESGTAQVVSYTSSGGANLYQFNGTVISNTYLLSNVGYRPSLSKNVNDATDVFISYMRSFETFTEVHNLVMSRTNYTSGANVWLNDSEMIFPDGSLTNFRPLVKVYQGRLFFVYVREDGFLVLEERSRDTGALIERKVTSHVVPDPSELVVDGDYDLCIGYVNGGTQLKFIKYEITNPGVFEEAWAVTTSNSNSLEKRSLELVQNISEHIIVSYLGYNSTTGLQDAFTFRINQLTGAVVWTLPIVTDIPTAVRFSGINYEGSFTNTSRVTLTSTIDVITFSANAIGSTTKLYTGSLPSGTPLYAGNPLIMFNQGEGWVIMAYRDVSTGVFRMIRAQVGEGSTRVDFDSIGYAITPGYDYYWRPLIFINPSIRGGDVEESTKVSGKLNGPYRKWYPNGHLQRECFYFNGTIISRDQNFSSDGQWNKEIGNYSGFSFMREWSVPNRTDLLAVFKNFDSNHDGFLSEAELLAGINSYDLTIPTEQFDLLVERMDKNIDGDIDYREFAQVIPLSIYTSGITTTIGFDHAILVQDCELLDGKRNENCTQYFDTLPALRVKTESFYTADKLNGPYTEYHPDGSVRIIANFTANQRTGSYVEKYNLENGNGLKEVIEYSPTGNGAPTGVRSVYNPAGWKEYDSVLVNDPSRPTYFLLITNRWSATQIKNIYYLDRKLMKIGQYEEYFESGATKVVGNYVRGLKEGLWTTAYETPNVKRLEEFYVKNRLSGPGARKTYSTTGVLISSEDYPVYS